MIKIIAKKIKEYDSDTFFGGNLTQLQAESMAQSVWSEFLEMMEGGTMSIDGGYLSDLYSYEFED